MTVKAKKTGARTGTATKTPRRPAKSAHRATPPKAKPASSPGKSRPQAVATAETAKTPAKEKMPKARANSRAVEKSKLALLASEPAGRAQPKSGRAKPKAPPQPLRIFQIYYRPEQRQYLDPAFEPYDNAGDNSPLLEFNVFRKLLDSNLTQGADLWGALSWKFGEKTGLRGDQLRAYIASHPGYDVYYCSPYPELEGLYHNLWLQGETSHPNFLVLCREFFEAAGLDPALLTATVASELFAASNYFVATPSFWHAYIETLNEVITKAEKRLSSTAKAMIYSNAADQHGLHAGASYLPFIAERLFGVYLAQNRDAFRSCKVPLPAKEEALNVHLKLLRQMKDVAVTSDSRWMATCWVNYRNMYMANAFGARWCNKHLKNITPTEFRYLK